MNKDKNNNLKETDLTEEEKKQCWISGRVASFAEASNQELAEAIYNKLQDQLSDQSQQHPE